MTESFAQLAIELHRELGASIAMCHEALTSARGERDRAYNMVVLKLADELVARTGMTHGEAQVRLASVKFDIERAVKEWQRDNPPPQPGPEILLANGIELAASVTHTDPKMRRYVHVIPRAEGYEVRLIAHLERFTEDAYGFDDDIAICDANTRVKCRFVDSIACVMNQLANWGCTANMLVPPSSINSCLVNNPIDSYLDLPHLHLSDETNTA